MSTFLLTFLFLIFSTNQISPANMDSAAVSSAIAKFSLQFCNELDKTKSVVSSPLSAEILLALLSLGSSEPALPELLGAIGIKDTDTIRSSFSQVASRLKSVKGVTLDVANRVFLKQGHELDAKLKDDAVKVFDAALEPMDFSDGAAAAKVINDWVESKTNNKIKDLISKDSLNAMTRLVLVNAIYFKGNWKHQFKAHNTMDKPFYVKKDTTVDVPMMYMEEKFRYGESEKLNAQLLEMPYEGEEASMLIVLPKDVEGLDAVLKQLATEVDLVQEMQSMISTKVQVTIPKFKIETEIDLKELLPKLGIKAIFNEENSGLTKILDGSEPLYVSKAIQKAFIEVNEEGAEAAAATAMSVMMCCAMVDFEPVPVFTADRPFLAAIQADGTLYFLAVHRGQE
ncbi:antichymotrypsin-2-like isoform X2 [Leguminivora glycinivorella]|uniref:antichymotrypsin-2-like isoform X2 n=1 Tax=Leguminivora glycinivorella TaxID=1035111 RepID=UPI00200CC346|nr:antichymotrypsin-2-like isoform X2 [Leguminivora glycinivorella]